MRVTKIAGKTAGAVVAGVDLVRMGDDEWAQLHDAFLAHGFLVIKANAMSAAEQTAFGQRFGTIEFGGAPMANRSKDGVMADVNSQQMRTNIGNEMWHTDSTYKPISSKVAMLTARALPPSGGGQTGLTDMRAAYDRLDAATKERIEHLSAYHSTQFSQANDMGDFPPENPLSIYHGNSYLRRLVKVHPDTGDRSVFVARHAFGACRSDDPSVQLPREESRELLARLVEDAVADESAVYVHEWEVGDTMVWDNRRLLHRAFPYDYAEPRVLMSTRVEGGEDCAADNVSGSFAGELSVAPSPEFPFGQCGRQVLEEELACQRQEVAEGVPRMLAATLPQAIEPGTTVGQLYVSDAQAQTDAGAAALAAAQSASPVPALSPAQFDALRGAGAATQRTKL